MFVGLVPRPAFLRFARRSNPITSAVSVGVASLATVLIASVITTMIPAQAPVGSVVVLEPVQVVAQQ